MVQFLCHVGIYLHCIGVGAKREKFLCVWKPTPEMDSVGLSNVLPDAVHSAWANIFQCLLSDLEVGLRGLLHGPVLCGVILARTPTPEDGWINPQAGRGEDIGQENYLWLQPQG